MKKILVLLLVVCFMCALSVPALAAGQTVNLTANPLRDSGSRIFSAVVIDTAEWWARVLVCCLILLLTAASGFLCRVIMRTGERIFAMVFCGLSLLRSGILFFDQYEKFLPEMYNGVHSGICVGFAVCAAAAALYLLLRRVKRRLPAKIPAGLLLIASLLYGGLCLPGMGGETFVLTPVIQWGLFCLCLWLGISSGLLSNSASLPRVLKKSGVMLQVLRKDGSVPYCSEKAPKLKPAEKEDILTSCGIDDVSYIAHLHMSAIPVTGGFAVYHKNTSELSMLQNHLQRLNNKTQQTEELLSGSMAIHEKLRRAASRNALYDREKEALRQETMALDVLLRILPETEGQSEKFSAAAFVAESIQQKYKLLSQTDENGFVSQEAVACSLMEIGSLLPAETEKPLVFEVLSGRASLLAAMLAVDCLIYAAERTVPDGKKMTRICVSPAVSGFCIALEWNEAIHFNMPLQQEALYTRLTENGGSFVPSAEAGKTRVEIRILAESGEGA